MNSVSSHCPLCERKLIESAPFIVSEVRPLPNPDSNWVPDYITKCWNCKKQIGIKKKGLKCAS